MQSGLVSLPVNCRRSMCGSNPASIGQRTSSPSESCRFLASEPRRQSRFLMRGGPDPPGGQTHPLTCSNPRSESESDSPAGFLSKHIAILRGYPSTPTLPHIDLGLSDRLKVLPRSRRRPVRDPSDGAIRPNPSNLLNQVKTKRQNRDGGLDLPNSRPRLAFRGSGEG